MDEDDIERWLQGYLRAWESNDPEDIGRLFTDEAQYHTAPHREPWTGRDAWPMTDAARSSRSGGWTRATRPPAS